MRLISLKIICLLFSIILSISNNDAQLTKDAIGKWKTEEYDREEEIKTTTYYTLGANGELKETIYYYVYTSEDDIQMIVKFKSAVKGRWKILSGDLNLSYNLSSLEVEYLGIKFPSSSKFESDLANALISGLGTDFIKESETEIFNSLYDHYENGIYFLNVRIQNNTMILTTEDGNIQLKRIIN